MKLIDACKELILSKKGRIWFSIDKTEVSIVVQDQGHDQIKIGKEAPEEFDFEGNDELADYIINKIGNKEVTNEFLKQWSGRESNPQE